MLAPDIIIIAPQKEVHVQSVYRYLRQKHSNISVSILNTASLPQNTNCRISLSDDNMHIALPGGGKSGISFDKLKSIWWWRPQPPVINKIITDEDQAKYAYRECCQMIEGLWYLLDCLWVNQPERQEVALNRVYQLEAAKMAGFKIPDTIVTNHPESVLEFWEKHQRQIIYRQLVPLAPKTFVFTEKELHRLDNLSLAPVIFQEIVRLDAWLQILIIGEATYSVRIFQGDDKKHVMKKYLLPNDVKKRILAYMRQSGLLYGKMSMGIDKNSNYVFLEMNPSASFLEIEKILKSPLSEIMGELLMRGRVRESQRVWPTLAKHRKQNE